MVSSDIENHTGGAHLEEETKGMALNYPEWEKRKKRPMQKSNPKEK